MDPCSVCDKVEEEEVKCKYHCPKCKASYCSLECSKKHKEICEKNATSADSSEPFFIDKTSLIFTDEHEHVVGGDTLRKLQESEELLDLLRNPHLRNYLRHIDSTYNPKGFMKLAMREPLFIEFANACTRVLHPERCQQELTLEEIEQRIQEKIEEAE